MKPLMLILLCYFTCIANAQLLIRNTTVVDVENKELLPATDVLIQDGRIAGMGKKLKTSSSVQVIDGSGKYLMPGLVDAHVHFFQSGGLYTRPDAIDLRKYKPYADEIQWVHNHMENFLCRYIAAGITTVVDVGSTINFLKQRDSFRNKTYAPTVYMTGPLLTTWEPEVFKNLGDDEPFYLMKTPDEARRYVEKQLPYKPDFIKIWYIVQGRNIDSAAHQHLPLVKAAIDEAHKSGLRVAVHATERITAQLAVEAGADFLVHDIEDEPIDAAFVQLLKTKNTVLSPTLVVAGNYYKTFGQYYTITADDLQYAHPTPLNSLLDLKKLKDTALTNRYRRSILNNKNFFDREDSIRRLNLKKLMDGGVTVATGTDAGNIGTQHVSSYFDELNAMQQSGLDNWQLLQASTINGAKAVGKEAEFGSIKKGKRADMLLLSKNPAEGFANWKSIEFVINKGVVIKPDTIVKYTPTELADQQLVAYNAHNLEAFVAPYADDVEIYDFPDKLLVKEKEQMRKLYGFLSRSSPLYCRLVNRIVQGNKVIDHEEVWEPTDKPFYGIVIYEIKNNKISRVYFLR